MQSVAQVEEYLQQGVSSFYEAARQTAAEKPELIGEQQKLQHMLLLQRARSNDPVAPHSSGEELRCAQHEAL